MRKKGKTFYSFLRGLDIFNLRLNLPFPQLRRKLATAIGGIDETVLQSADIMISQDQIQQSYTLLSVYKKY